MDHILEIKNLSAHIQLSRSVVHAVGDVDLYPPRHAAASR